MGWIREVSRRGERRDMRKSRGEVYNIFNNWKAECIYSDWLYEMDNTKIHDTELSNRDN